MSYTIYFKEEAKNDIIDAYDWYENKQKNLGEIFVSEIERYLDILKRKPLIFRERKKQLRYCPIKRFPFIIVFEVENKAVIVYAIFNTYQHPSQIDSRK
ncbi:type II toxin-antitoxin system RelE/ParE family toxin [Carboxylicivirga sp. N1Y90]|uniref:type II toxin-antitoxin system RelE/ParE family toxin n=1 Tax=Carboxylicivirga fragile TaxID=3417571 RepID=UPI003D356CA0|nr:type II toxin-antitoxin system RelE/ParE family toxin [Marinilabiliaceae bacterium N1Y90]